MRLLDSLLTGKQLKRKNKWTWCFLAWVSQDSHCLSLIIPCISAVKDRSATGVLLFFFFWLWSTYILCSASCLKTLCHWVWAVPCYPGQIIGGIHTEHILEQGDPIWLYLRKNIFCHSSSLSLTTILVFYNCKSGAGILNITLFFIHNIKSKMIVFIRHCRVPIEWYQSVYHQAFVFLTLLLYWN